MSIEDDVEDHDEERVEGSTLSPFTAGLLLGMIGTELEGVPEQAGSTGLDDQFRRLVAKPRLRFRRRLYRRLG